MHDIGTSRPGGWGPGYNEFEQELAGEFGQELAGEFEFESQLGYAETEFENEFENEFETEVSGEMQELELAAELLSVNNEQQMEQFLGGLIKSVGRVATNFAKSSAGKALGGILRSAVKSALPVVGGALGNLIVPGAGGVIGGKLASMAGSAVGLELEGLSNEDREFEVARRLVRIGQHAANHLVSMPPNVPPSRAARIAFLRGANQVAPGLLPVMRQIARTGIAAARQSATPIFGPAGASVGTPVPAYGVPRPNAQGMTDASASCPNCGSAQSQAANVPSSGVWRRSRSGRTIILYLGAPRPGY
ncbi:hypothetical protein ACAW63_16785 [Pseudomonas sp. QE6]|uniref:hypothetical protein n=1 Tax=Pseudomonas sp. QE6 TaxID=3242491 RepID=UPI003528F09A